MLVGMILMIYCCYFLLENGLKDLEMPSLVEDNLILLSALILSGRGGGGGGGEEGENSEARMTKFTAAIQKPLNPNFLTFSFYL